MLYLIALILIVVLLAANAKESCGSPLKFWILGSMGFYVAQFILSLLGWHYLKLWRTSSMKYFMVSGAMSIVYSGWLIWGNIMYYNDEGHCLMDAPGLMVTLCLLIIFGYFDMMKCLVFGCVGGFYLVMVVRGRRNAGAGANWIPAPP